HRRGHHRLLDGFLPGAHRLGEEGLAGGLGRRRHAEVGGGHDRGEGEHAIGVLDGERLGDHAAHRGAHHVRGLPAERVHQPGRVLGHVLQEVGRGPAGSGGARVVEMGRQARVAVVEPDDVVPLLRELCAEPVVPVDELGAQPHDQKERAPAGRAEALVRDVDAVGRCDRGHGPRMSFGSGRRKDQRRTSLRMRSRPSTRPPPSSATPPTTAAPVRPLRSVPVAAASVVSAGFRSATGWVWAKPAFTGETRTGPGFPPWARDFSSFAFFFSSAFSSASSSARTVGGGVAGLRSMRLYAPVEKATGWFFRPRPSPHLVMTYSTLMWPLPPLPSTMSVRGLNLPPVRSAKVLASKSSMMPRLEGLPGPRSPTKNGAFLPL